MEDQTIFKLIKAAVGFVLVVAVVFGSFGTVQAGQRGIKTRFGSVVGVVDTGLYMKLPFVEQVHKMNVKTLTVSFDNGKDSTGASLSSASKDLQDVQISTVVNYHIDATKVGEIYQQYNSVENFQSNVLEPTIRETIKATSALYTAEELVTKRAEFSDKAQVALTEAFTSKNAILEKFNVTDFQFSQSFTEAIEKKVTATQNAEASKNQLEQVKYEAQQTIETAKATAEAQRIQSQSLAAQGGADYVQLQAIAKWDGHLPAQMIPGSTVPFLQLHQ